MASSSDRAAFSSRHARAPAGPRVDRAARAQGRDCEAAPQLRPVSLRDPRAVARRARAIVAAARREAWPITGAADHLVSEALYLDDPDGLGIEIYRDRPRAWRVANGELAMATDPLDLQACSTNPAPRRRGGPRSRHGDGPRAPHVPHLEPRRSSIAVGSASSRWCGVILARCSSPPAVPSSSRSDTGRASARRRRRSAVGLRSFTIEAGDIQPDTVVDNETCVTVVLSRT